jgi:hypothetical protein
LERVTDLKSEMVSEMVLGLEKVMVTGREWEKALEKG